MLEIMIDGETVDTCSADSFIDNNETLSTEDTDAIRALSLGSVYSAGGGAAVAWSVRRIA